MVNYFYKIKMNLILKIIIIINFLIEIKVGINLIEIKIIKLKILIKVIKIILLI